MYGMQYRTCGIEYSERDYAEQVARWAKMELLKEKVKQRMDAKYGKQLDAVADLVVEMLEERAKSVDALEEQEHKLADAFDALYVEDEE